MDVEGLGVKTLDKLCKNILHGDTDDNVIQEFKNKPNRSRGQYLIPALSPYQINEVSSAIGIHLYATGISWAKIEKKEHFLKDWNSFDFDLGTKKLTPADALHLVSLSETSFSWILIK